MDELRENFVIKIVPMINIDGVVNGNYRSNFSGNDVNRQWLEPSRRLHPEIYNLKQEILSNKKNVHFFLDLHAHSRK
jgi:murein tripeptide amidase MpaA